MPPKFWGPVKTLSVCGRPGDRLTISPEKTYGHRNVDVFAAGGSRGCPVTWDPEDPALPEETKCPRPGKCGPPAPTAPESSGALPGDASYGAAAAAAPESARAAPPAFPSFALLATESASLAAAGAESACAGAARERPGRRSRARGLSAARPAATEDARGLPAATAPHALPRCEPRRSRGRAAAGGRLLPGSAWGPGAPPAAAPSPSGRCVRAPRWPSPAPKQRRNRFSVGYVEEGPDEEKRRKTGVGGERGEGNCRWLDWRGSFRFLFSDIREKPLCQCAPGRRAAAAAGS